MSARSFASWSLCAQSLSGLRTVQPGHGPFEACATRLANDFGWVLSAESLAGDLSAPVAAASESINAAQASNVHRTRGKVGKKLVFISNDGSASMSRRYMGRCRRQPCCAGDQRGKDWVRKDKVFLKGVTKRPATAKLQ